MQEEMGLLGREKLRRQAMQARQESDKLQALHTIGTSISSALQVEQVLTRVVEAAVYITGAEEASLLLLDEDTQELYLRAQKGLGAKYAEGFKIKTEDSVAGEVVRTGQPHRLISPAQDLKVVTGYMVNAIVYVPVIGRRGVIGVLSADNQVKDRAFTASDERLLVILAGYAAMALENARLLEELERQTQTLAEAHGIGRLEPSRRIDAEGAAVVLAGDSGIVSAEELPPGQVATVIDPYLRALSGLQHLIDEMQSNPPSNVRVLAAAQRPPVIAKVEGAVQAVAVINEVLVPWKGELGPDMAQVLVREKEAALMRAKLEVLKAQARAARDEVQRERLLVEASTQAAEAERGERAEEELRRKLQSQKIQLALDIVTRIKPDLSVEERVAYVVRLLPFLEEFLSSPLQVTAAQELRAESSGPQS